MQSPLAYTHGIHAWDLLLAYGDVILFHLALSIISCYKSQLLAANSSETMMDVFLRKITDMNNDMYREVIKECKKCQSHNMLLCYASLCYVMLCYVMSFHPCL